MKRCYPVINNKKSNKEIFYSPLKGSVKDINEMQDGAFKSIGKGICIIPSEGKVIAPCDGILTSLFPTGHAVGVTSNLGAEILIHIGTDTVQLSDGFFIKHKKQGDYVSKGDVLISFDLNELNKHFNSETAIIVTNSESYLDVIRLCDMQVNYCDEILLTIKSEIKN